MFPYFIENKLIYENQSGFKPGDSFANQLLAINYEILFSFDDNPEVRGIFLDISKLSIKCGTRELFISLNATGSQEIY